MRITLLVLMILSSSACTALLVGGATNGGHQQGRDQREAAQVTRDSATTATINNRLMADSTVNAIHVSVDTYANRVTLRGTVGSYAARAQAERLAASVDAVVSVNNEIKVESRP
jgi:osmotically-inducible protein OsmY